MRVKPSVIVGYLVLLLVSLGVIAFHHYLANHAIENTRRGILPTHYPFWRWFGELAWMFLLISVTFLLLSFRYDRFARVTVLFRFAAVQLVFITIYGVDCVFLLSHILSD